MVLLFLPLTVTTDYRTSTEVLRYVQGRESENNNWQFIPKSYQTRVQLKWEKYSSSSSQ